jgi:TonB family protein
MAVFACGALTFAQAPATPPPATPPPDSQQPAPAQPASAVDEQQPSPGATPANEPVQSPAAEPAKPNDKDSTLTEEELREAAATEDQLTRKLVGKTFYLRGGYLDNTLHFNEKGALDGSSPKASYTLSLVQIDKVKVDKHHVELEGVRYGLHFLGALASEDQAANVDRVKLTSKKKPLKISIDREIVVVPKKAKEGKKKSNEKKPAPAPPASSATAASAAPPTSAPTPQDAPGAHATPPQEATVPSATPSTAAADATTLAPEPMRHGVTVTTSPAEAARMLGTALENIFSPGIDDRMIATLPDSWRLYYKAVTDKADYRPGDPAILRASQVDKAPHLTKSFEPPSNEFAQNNGVAGLAMYHVIVGPDGIPGEIAIGRPIGFGLDENAVDAIRKATFEPGMKDGKAVPVEVDLTVQFRIYSKRTAAIATDAAKADEKGRKLPGPYSVNLPQQQPPAQQPQPQQ